MKVPGAVWLIVAATLLYLGLRAFERAMIFVPSRAMTLHPGSVGLAWEPLWLTAEDGVRLRAWRLPGPDEKAPVLLCLHGNAGNLSNRVEKMKIFHDAGAGQLWVEWRGYGESGGSPSEQGLYRDARAGWAELTERMRIPPDRVVLYGESLGCGAAIQLATEKPAAGLIVESGFSSMAEMAKLVLPWMPEALISARFDNRAKLASVRMPKLFLHSREDDIIPHEQALANFRAAPEPKRLVDLRGTHNEGFLDSQPDYGRAIAAFLRGLSS